MTDREANTAEFYKLANTPNPTDYRALADRLRELNAEYRRMRDTQ